MWWHTVTHGRGSEGETGEWSGYPVPFTLPRNVVYPALLPLTRTPRLPVVDWTDAPADLNGLVPWAERRNLVSARVPSHFNWPLPASLLVPLPLTHSALLPTPLWLLVPCFSHRKRNYTCNPEILWFSVAVFESSKECTSDTVHVFYMPTYFGSSSTYYLPSHMYQI